MTFTFKRNQLVIAVAAAVMLPAMNTYAGGTISFGEDKSVSVGLGMRGSFSSVENGAPNGTLTRTDLAASEKDKCFSAFVVGEYCLMHGLSWEAKMAFEWCAQTARDANEPPWWFQEKAAQRLNGMTVDNRSLQ